jgi:hypothetical protein
MTSDMNIDEAQLRIQAVQAIAEAATEDGAQLSEELSAALFWGLAHLAKEAHGLLSDNDGACLTETAQ